MEDYSPTPVPTPQPATGPEAPKANVALPGAFSLFTPSVEALKTNLGTFVALLLTPMAAGFALYIALFIGALSAMGGGGDSQSMGAIFAIFMLLVMLVVTVGGLIFNVAQLIAELKSATHETVGFVESLKAGVGYVWKYFLLSVVVGIATLLGLLLFIVPGIFIIKRYFLAPYYLIDRNVGVFEAMRLSAADSKRFSGAVWGLLGVQLLVGLSAIIPIVGLILCVLYLCAPAIRYYQIKEASGVAATPAVPGA